MSDSTSQKSEANSENIEDIFQNSLQTHKNTTISIRATEILARYDLSVLEELDEINKLPEEIGIFTGIPQTIPLVDAFIRTDETETIYKMTTEHFIKFESPDLVMPLYVQIPKNELETSMNSSRMYISDKYEQFIGKSTSQPMPLNPTGELLGETITDVVITENSLKIPSSARNYIQTNTSDDESEGFLNKFFNRDTTTNQSISRNSFTYRVDCPSDLESIYIVEHGKQFYDEELVVTVSLDQTEGVCEFKDVDSNTTYQVDLVNGQMGKALTQFFQRIGSDNLDDKFTVYRTYFPDNTTVNTNTYGVHLRPN